MSRVQFPYSTNICVHEHVCLYWVFLCIICMYLQENVILVYPLSRIHNTGLINAYFGLGSHECGPLEYSFYLFIRCEFHESFSFPPGTQWVSRFIVDWWYITLDPGYTGDRSTQSIEELDDPGFSALQRAIAEVKQRWSVIGRVTKILLYRTPLCFGRHVKLLVPAAFVVVSTHQFALYSRGGLWPVLFLCNP
jgi:hypothetical protein